MKDPKDMKDYEEDIVNKCAAVPLAARRKYGWAENIGGAQGGGEPLGAVKITDLWEAFDLLRSRLAWAWQRLEQNERDSGRFTPPGGAK